MAKLFELSQTTAQLIAYLKPFEKGTMIDYRELSRAVNTEITSRSGRLTYARFVLQRDHNAIWICIRPGVGIRRLNDMEIAERLPTFWLNGARNKLHRGSSQADVVELAELDIDQQARFSVDCIQRELAFEALSKATRRKMEKVARGSSNDLPAFTAVEWAISLSPRVAKK